MIIKKIIILCFLICLRNILLGENISRQELTLLKIESFSNSKDCFIIRIINIYYKYIKDNTININHHVDKEELINIIKSNLGDIDIKNIYYKESVFLIKDTFEINYQCNKESRKSHEIFRGTVITFNDKDIRLNFKYQSEQSVLIDASKNLWSTTGDSYEREGKYAIGENILISSSSFEETNE